MSFLFLLKRWALGSKRPRTGLARTAPGSWCAAWLEARATQRALQWCRQVERRARGARRSKPALLSGRRQERSRKPARCGARWYRFPRRSASHGP